jgi:hypothetical protein
MIDFSSVHSFIHSFIHSFVLLKNQNLEKEKNKNRRLDYLTWRKLWKELDKQEMEIEVEMKMKELELVMKFEKMKCEGGHEMRRRMIVTKCEFSNNDSR